MKWLIIMLVMLLAFYPIGELTNYILKASPFYPELLTQFKLEIAIMWVLYLSIIPVLNLALKK